MKIDLTRSWMLLAIFPVLFVAVSGCKSKAPEQPPDKGTAVKVAPVVRKALAIPIHTSGQLSPKAVVKLSFKVGGLVAKLHVDEGDTVQKGQVLAALDLSEIDARFNQANNAFLKAQRDLRRVENLQREKAATLEQLQDAETAFQVAEANLRIAKFNLEHSKIRAPARGKILKRMAEQGEMIGVGMPVFLFGSTENRWVVKVGVSERDIVRIALGDQAAVRFDAYPEKRFSASVSEIAQALDPASGTYEVELALEQAAGKGFKLIAGFVAKAVIEPAAKETYFIIPVDAIVEGEGSAGTVFTVKEGKAQKVSIRLAHIFPETAAVQSGLEGIESVVTSGAAYLREGSPVQVIGSTANTRGSE